MRAPRDRVYSVFARSLPIWVIRGHGARSNITLAPWNYYIAKMAHPYQGPPAKDWCFTLNNPRSKDITKLQSLEYGYLVYQLEIGEQGTPHIQGFVQMREKQRLASLHRLVKRARFAKRKGTPYEASHYCKKPVPDCECKHCKDLEAFDNVEPFEDGFLSVETQYKLYEIAKVIKEHGLQRCIDRFPDSYITLHNGMKALDKNYAKKRDFKTAVTILWGEPGSGKTRYAMETFPEPYVLPCGGGKGSADFFGDYRPELHQSVIVDDFYSYWHYSKTFLKVTDRYPIEVQTKGGFLQFLAHDLVFTSNLSPDKWYPNILSDPVRKDSFFRRITNIIHFTGTFTYTVTKGEMPYPPPDWLHQENVHQALMRQRAPQNIPAQQPAGQQALLLAPSWTSEQMDDAPQFVDVVPPSIGLSSALPRSAYESRAAWFRANRSNRQ